MKRSKVEWIGLGLALCAVGLVLACRHSRRRPGEPNPDPVAYANYPQIATLERLHRYIVVSKVIEDPGPPLSVTSVVRAKTRTDEWDVQYRYFFLDEAGRPLEADPDWRFMHLPARTQMYMEGNALDSTAVDWRLEIRPAR